MLKTIIIVITIFGTVNLQAVPTNIFQQSPIQAQTYFREGIRQVKRQNYRSAIRSFRSAVQHDPNLGEAYLNLGACYERIGQFENSIPYFEKAISVNDSNPRLVYLFGVALGRNNRRKEAVKYLERAVYMDPKNADYLYNLGVGYSSLTQYASAATCYEQVTGIISNNSAVWYNLGLAKLYLAKTNEAESAWEKVEIDSPVAAPALYYLGLMAYNRHDYKPAMSKVKMSLALNPNFVDAQYMKAILLGEEGKYNSGINLLEKVYLIKQGNEIEKKIALLYAKWAETAVEQKEYKMALHRYRQAGTYMPEDPEIQINIAKAALKARKYDVATQTLDRAQRISMTEAHEEAINELRKKLQTVNGKSK
ncbi:tetratricopeptide repeat protein [bacterium]|nr:tetratricopeptide repeat protein [bacterium]